MNRCPVLLVLVSLLVTGGEYSRAADPGKLAGPAGTAKIAANDHYRPFLINNIFNYYGNNGDGSYNPYSTDNEGFEFIKGDGKHILFEDGVVWGGFHKGRTDPTVGGSVYRHGLQAGPIVTYGTATTDPVAADPVDARHRVYRVRPDIGPFATFSDVQSKLDADEIPYIGRFESVTASDLYNQYVTDWNEWPADLGAPFTDMDGNGTYDPLLDIPGVPGSDQTLWYVANDMDSVRVQRLTGSPSIGLEMQRAVWGYRRDGALGSTIFMSTILINKSGAPVDSMFLVQWTDPDLGNAGDDFVGCDTSRNLGYVYNGDNNDESYGPVVPAGGFVLLQGPIVPAPGQTGIFRGRERPDYRNLHMTSFVFFTSGYVADNDPRQGQGCDVEWYGLMNGLRARDGSPFIDPTTNQPSTFCFYGDPVRATDGSTGWVDGLGGFTPQDRRMCMISGPFTMAAGDTQELVTAALAGLGADRFSSISVLRSVRDAVQSVYNSQFVLVPPLARAEVSFASPVTRVVTVKLDGTPYRVLGFSGAFHNDQGSVGSSFQLYDDGTHGDSAAGDKQFTAVQSVSAALDPLSLDVTVTDSAGAAHTWTDLVEGISVAGPLYVAGILFSDNLNDDGTANPGENLRFGLSLTNSSIFELQNLALGAGPTLPAQPYTVASLSPAATHTMIYVDTDPNSYFYFSVNVPSSFQDTTLTLPVTVSDSRGNSWSLSVSFPVVPLGSTPRSAVISSNAVHTGSFAVSVVNPAEVRDHLYVIEGVTSINDNSDPGFTLRDSTDGRVLLVNHPLPDPLGHTVPVTDGFKVLLGTITQRIGIRSWGIRGTRRWTWADGAGFGLEHFANSDSTEYGVDPDGGTIGNAFEGWLSSGVGPDRMRRVEIHLSAGDSAWSLTMPRDENMSRGYRYMRSATAAPARPEFAPFVVNATSGYAYQDYNYSVPFAVWDVDTVPARRLAVGHLENNQPGGRVDGRWWPALGTTVGGTANVDSPGPREWWFIFDKPYSDTPDTALMKDILNNRVDMMYMGTNTRRAGGNPIAGDGLVIQPFRRPRNGDIWTFNPTVLVSAPEAGLPAAFRLEQNYPNPFNPSTTIRFHLPTASRVTLRIYDLLGREVATLMDGVVHAGVHQVRWNARMAASGVYFCRLEAIPQDGRGVRHSASKKLLVLR